MKARRILIIISTLVVVPLCLSFAAPSSGALPQKRSVTVTARVTDANNTIVSGAHVAIFQGDEHLGAQDTDGRGIAKVEISVSAGSEVELILEISKKGVPTRRHKMKLGTSFSSRLPLEEIELEGDATRVDTVLPVKVIGGDGKSIPDALVEVIQGGRSVGEDETNSGGVAEVKIYPAPNQPISIQVSKEGLRPELRPVNLPANIPAQLPLEEIRMQSGSAQQVVLTVRVEDESGAVLPTALVNVYSGDATSSFQSSIAWAALKQEYTAANGTVRFDFPVSTGSQTYTLEVSREDKMGERRLIQITRSSPTWLPTETVRLKARVSAQTEATSIVNIKVRIVDEGGNPLEGAQVSSQPPGTGITKKQQGVTGPDGYTVLGMPLWSADNYEKFTLEVSKPGYKDNKGGIEIDNKYNRANGKTFDAKPISLLKLAGDISVKITVLDGETNNGVGDAEVIIEGPQYATATTNTSGVAPLAVDKPGTYKVRISQDNYWPTKDAEIHIAPGVPPNFDFRLRRKPTKDAAADSIDITVLAKDSIDDKEPHPLRGAAVTDGRGTSYTDERGQVNLRGAFDRAQDISVSATDYKPMTRRVTVAKRSLLGNATGKETFILDPALSSDSPIRLVVEVFDASTESKIDNAYVYAYFLDKGKEIQLATSKTENGEAQFALKGSDSLPLSKLRAGLRIYGKAVGYLLSPSDITDLRVPSLEPKRLTIFLKRDWDALTKEIEALEIKVNAWKFAKGPDPAEMQKFINKANLVRQEAQNLFKEIEAGAKRFPELTTFGSQTICSRSGKLLLDIRSYERQVNQKADELEKTLKEAEDRAPRCASVAEAEALRASSRKAIQLVAEIGALKKKAVEDHDDLELVAAKSGAAPQLLAEMKAKADQLTTLADAAGLNDLQAAAYYKRKAVDPIEPVVLVQELEKLKKKIDQEAGVPPELLNRTRVMAQLLSTSRAAGQSAQSPAATVTNARADITALQTRAAAIISGLGSVCSNFPTLDDVVERIDNRNYTISTFGIRPVAELATLADACVARATKGPAPQTGSKTTADNTDDKTSTGSDKDNKPAQAADDPGIKIDKPGKPTQPGTQDTSSGGFWDAAKAGKRDVENKVGNKPAKSTNPATTGETSDNKGTTNTATNKSSNKPTNPLLNTDEKSADKSNTITSKSGNNQTDSSSTLEVPADKKRTDTTGNKTSNQTKPANGTEESAANSRPANSTTNKTTGKTNNPPITVEEIPEERIRPAIAANKPTTGGGQGAAVGSGVGNRGAVSPPSSKPPVGDRGPVDGRPICDRLPPEIRAQFAAPSGKLSAIDQGIAGGPACRGDLNTGQPQYLSFYVERTVQPSPSELVQPSLGHGATAVAGLGELSSEEDYRGERIVYIIHVARGPYYLSVEGLPQSQARLRQLAQQLDAALKTWSRQR